MKFLPPLALIWVALFVAACAQAATNPNQGDRAAAAFAAVTADLLFGREQRIDFRPSTGIPDAQAAEDGRCVSTADRPQYSWIRELLPAEIRSSQTNIGSYCDQSRAYLADFARTFDATPDERSLMLFIDTYRGPLAARYDDLFGARRITEGFFGSETARCQLYLRAASPGRVDLAVVKARAPGGTLDLQDSRQRECVARALLRSFGFVGGGELSAAQLFDSDADLGSCRPELAQRAHCPPIVGNRLSFLYLSGLRRRGMLSPGPLDRQHFLALVRADPDAAGFADQYRRLQSRDRHAPVPVPTIQAR